MLVRSKCSLLICSKACALPLSACAVLDLRELLSKTVLVSGKRLEHAVGEKLVLVFGTGRAALDMRVEVHTTADAPAAAGCEDRRRAPKRQNALRNRADRASDVLDDSMMRNARADGRAYMRSVQDMLDDLVMLDARIHRGGSVSDVQKPLDILEHSADNVSKALEEALHGLPVGDQFIGRHHHPADRPHERRENLVVPEPVQNTKPPALDALTEGLRRVPRFDEWTFERRGDTHEESLDRLPVMHELIGSDRKGDNRGEHIEDRIREQRRCERPARAREIDEAR